MDRDEGIAERAEPPAGSLEDLYLRHAPAAVRLAFLLTHDGATAEDVAQEAFIRAAGRFRHLRSPDAFDAYLRRTVVNLCHSHHRHEKVVRGYLAAEAGRAGGHEPASTLPDVETRDEVRTAIGELPERQRAAVILRFYEDLSEAQVAHALHCSIPAARSLVFRAMETLRGRIGGDGR